jgi:hypothetical protein
MEENVIFCRQCVMDSIGNPEFYLDSEGICNYCHEYRMKEEVQLLKPTVNSKPH